MSFIGAALFVLLVCLVGFLLCLAARKIFGTQPLWANIAQGVVILLLALWVLAVFTGSAPAPFLRIH